MAQDFGAKRNRRKALRIVVQLAILFAIVAGLWYMIDSIRTTREEEPPEPVIHTPSPEKMQREKGFVALSYAGVVRGAATGSVIGQDQLEAHLKALYDHGYVTISQQDLYAYYYEEQALPERALFLIFEDGLKRSATLAQPILEKFGYTATMLTYAKNLVENDGIYLSSQDLLAMEETGVWETGVNGYRLSYINVFDRHGHYLGELTTEEFPSVSSYLDRRYDHYLMDFLRDRQGVPMETQEQMAERIAEEYRLMASIYTNKLDRMPLLYTILHANTGQFATNDQVSIENERWIRTLYPLNFNREMRAWNDASVDPLNLTRMQPQAYWSVNHLLMRVLDDAGSLADMEVYVGDAQRGAQWDLVQGAAQWAGDTVRVTSLPEGSGIIRWSEGESLQDFYASAYFEGNLMGKQSLDILSSGQEHAYTAVELEKNVLTIYACCDGSTEAPIFTLDIGTLDDTISQTMEENRIEALDVEIAVKSKQVYKADESRKIAQVLTESKAYPKNGNADTYVEKTISVRDDGTRYMEVLVIEGRLYVSVDHVLVVSDLTLPTGQADGLALRAGWSTSATGDGVYDADFRDLYISTTDGAQAYLDYRKSSEPVIPMAEETEKPFGRRLLEWIGMEDFPLIGGN